MSENQGDSTSLIGLSVDNGRYEIVKLIGEGGMGRVFKARQVSMDRMVALKILRAQMAQDPQLLARFQQEALSVSRLRHPNTITYFDYGRTEDDYLFIAMELLGGQSLFSVLRNEQRLPMGRMLHIMEQVTGAVAEAHRLGVVHRDLKPENIQIDTVAGDPDFVKVLDFGIAKIIQGDNEDDEVQQKGITIAGTIFGTPHYMSPEQVHGRKVDHRTDIYSLGIIMYELLAGKPPFDGATPMAVMMAQASKPAPDIRETEADVTPELADIIMRCLAKEVDDRIEDADQLLAALRQLRGAPVSGRISAVNMTPSGSVEQMRNTPGAMPVLDPVPVARHTPAPSIDSQADAQRTPDVVGHLTVPPMGTSDFDLEAPPTSNKGGLVAALLLAVLVLGGGAFWWSQQGDDPVEQPVATTQTQPEVVAIGEEPTPKPEPAVETPKPEPKAEPDAAAAPEPPPAPKMAHYRVDSKPAGAAVFVGEEKLGETPFDWKPEVADAPVTLRFERAGYKPGTHEQTLEPAVEGEVASIIVQLDRKRARPRPKPKPKPKVEEKPKPKPTGGGYEKL